MAFTPSSIVTQTSQGWKFYVGGGVTVISGIAMFGGLRGDGNLIMFVGGMATCLLSLIATWFSIRCPKCKAPWVWMAVSTQKHNHWGDWLFSLKACPKCGFDANPK